MRENKTRLDLILDLEEFFRKRVFAIIYNPDFEEGVKKGDEIYFFHFIEEIIKKENIKECVFILCGFGGNLQTSILCSEILRKSLSNYDIFVPTVAASSLCYFILQSNRLLIGKNSFLTQVDPTFEYEGCSYRAIKCLYHPDPKINSLAKEYFNSTLDNLKRVVTSWPNVFDREISKRSVKKIDYLQKVIDHWMNKEEHDSSITSNELIKLRVNFKKVESLVVDYALNLIKECMRELQLEGQRFMIQTNRKEEGLYGGFFYP